MKCNKAENSCKQHINSEGKLKFLFLNSFAVGLRSIVYKDISANFQSFDIDIYCVNVS